MISILEICVVPASSDYFSQAREASLRIVCGQLKAALIEDTRWALAATSPGKVTVTIPTPMVLLP